MCAKQAKIAFQEWNNNVSGLKPVSSGYENHYNTKLNKCFITMGSIDQMGKEFPTTATLMDVRAQSLCGLWLDLG
jgi:hypothetical protein